MFRIQPGLPITVFRTFEIKSPLSTHWKPATCKEVDCEHYLKGWATTVIKGSDDEAIIRSAGRQFIEERSPNNMVRFVFHAEQPCFRAHTHKLPIGKPELYVVRDGDWRGNPTGYKVNRKADEWVDEFTNNQDRVNIAIQRG